MEVVKVVDATGLACPMPIVQAKRAIDSIASGEVLEIHVTDQGAKSDLTAWTASGGHELMKHVEDDGVFKFWIKKG